MSTLSPFFIATLPISSTLMHEASVLKELDDMPPDQYQAELCETLTAFYEKILKKVCAGGRPVGKPLARKFEAKKAPVPVTLPSSSCEDADEGHRKGREPPPPPPAAAQTTAGCLRKPGATDAPPQSGAPLQNNVAPEGWWGLCLIRTCLC